MTRWLTTSTRLRVRRIVLFAALMVITSGAAFAQKDVKLDKTPRAFREFYAKFTNAVKRGDRQAVASMTSFPFSYGFDTGDEGHWTRAQFLKNFHRFLSPVPRIMKSRNPVFSVEGDSYGLAQTWDASNFGFERKGGTFKFVSYMVEP